MTTQLYKEATRVQTSLLASLEKRCLIWMAERMPPAINSDHLTLLAAVSMLAAGLCYWNGSPAALLAAVGLLAVNWFGDSLGPGMASTSIMCSTCFVSCSFLPGSFSGAT
jgi:hypothetical protein